MVKNDKPPVFLLLFLLVLMKNNAIQAFQVFQPVRVSKTWWESIAKTPRLVKSLSACALSSDKEVPGGFHMESGLCTTFTGPVLESLVGSMETVPVFTTTDNIQSNGKS